MSTPIAGARKTKIKNNVDVATSVLETGQKLYGMAKEYWNKNFSYTITISERDPLYGEVLDWLTVISPNEKYKALTVSSSRNPRGDGSEATVSEGSMSDSVTSPLVVRFNEGKSKNIRIEEYRVNVSVVTPEISEKTISSYEQSKIVFTMATHSAQKAVLRQLEDINAQRGKSRKAVLKMVGQWNGWTTRSDLPARSMASVALPPSQKSRIVKDLATFLESEDKYNRLAIPWHRGYMFYGPPGTGKTSLVKALANEFNLDLWYISLSDLKAESSLINLLAEVGPRSLLLLEDIDTVKITHDREGEQGKISLSSLLNTLDGVATPHGLIAVMTTNHFEVLDIALTRAGRMDLIEHLDYPTLDTIGDMYNHFYGKQPKWSKSMIKDEPIDGLSTSQVAEVMKRHMDDGGASFKAIVDLIEEVSNGGS